MNKKSKKKQSGGNNSNPIRSRGRSRGRSRSRSRSRSRNFRSRDRSVGIPHIGRQTPPDINVNSANIDALGMEVYRLKVENQDLKNKYTTLQSEVKYIESVLGIKKEDIIYEVSG